MNCKPGDLAYVTAPWIEQGRGRVVQVLRAPTMQDLHNCGYVGRLGFAVWYCEGDIVAWDGPRRAAVMADESLRPLRDPGDSARDETLDWLPVPGRAREVA